MQITEKQLSLVNERLQAIISSDNYFGKMYRELGITQVRTAEDFLKLPFVDKAELRNAYPLGIQAVPDEEIVRIHSRQKRPHPDHPWLWPVDCRYRLSGRL